MVVIRTRGGRGPSTPFVFVPALGDLVLSGALVSGVPSSGTILNATTGSTIASTVPGLTVNSAARTYSYNGTGSVGAVQGLTETLAGATFSPRNNVVTISSASVPAFTANPSITPASGDVNTTFTMVDGAMSGGGQVLSRRWLLNGTSIGTGRTIVTGAQGSLVAENTGTGNVVATSTAVTVSASTGTPTPAGAVPAIGQYVLPSNVTGGETGKGFTCTGLARDPLDGTWWIGNDGRAAGGTLGVSSVVHVSSDFSTVIKEITSTALGLADGHSCQGVTMIGDRIAALFKRPGAGAGLTDTVATIERDGTLVSKVTSTSTTADFNGLAYDTLRGLFISTSATGISWRNPSDFAAASPTKAYSISGIDQIHYDATNDTVLTTGGANGSAGVVTRYRASDFTEVGRTTIAAATAIEGIVQADGKWVVVSDGWFHNGGSDLNAAIVLDARLPYTNTVTTPEPVTPAPTTSRLAILYDGDIDDDTPTLNNSGTLSGLNETDDETVLPLMLAAQDWFDIRGVYCGAQDGNIAGAQQVYGTYDADRRNLVTYTATPSNFLTRAQLDAITLQGSRLTTNGATRTPAKGYRDVGDAEYDQAHAVAQAFIAEVQAGVASGKYDTSADPYKKLWLWEAGAPTMRAQATREAVDPAGPLQFPDLWKYVRIAKASLQNDRRDINARRYLMGYGNSDATAGMIGYGPSGTKGPAGDMYLIQWGLNPISRQETACSDATTAGQTFYNNSIRQHGATGAMTETFAYTGDGKPSQAQYFRAADGVSVWWLLRAAVANNFDPTASIIGGASRLYNGEPWVDSDVEADIAVTKTGWPTGYADTTTSLTKSNFQALASELYDRFLIARPSSPAFTSLERGTLSPVTLAPVAPSLIKAPFGLYPTSATTTLAEGTVINAYKPLWARGVWGGTYPMTYAFQWQQRVGVGAWQNIGTETAVYTALTIPTFADGLVHEIGLAVYAANAGGTGAITRLSIGTVQASASTGDTTAPTITSGNSFSQPENSALSQQLTANETVTWSIVGGADAAKFSLTSGGLLTLPSQDYETPTDADGNRTYIVTVRAADAAGNVSTDQTITVTITDVAEGGGEDAATTAWVNAQSVPPTTQRRSAYDTFVKSLKAVGSGVWWATRDRIMLGAVHDGQAARLDIKNPAGFIANVFDAPAFVTDAGWQSNLAGYLEDTLNLGDGVARNYTQNNAAVQLAASLAARAQSGGGRMLSTTTLSLTPRSSADTTAARLNNTSPSTTIASTNGRGLFTLSRTDSANYDTRKNGVSLGVLAFPSVALTNMPVRYLKDQSTGYGASGNSLMFLAVGSAVSTADDTAVLAALNEYLTAIGQATL